MGIKSETRYVFGCDRCTNEETYSGWGEAEDAGWRKVALFTDDAQDTDDMTWDILCPQDIANLQVWLHDRRRALT